MTSLKQLADRVAEEFKKKYGRPPRWIVAAPGRVNVIGEHTDYNDGFVLPFALSRGTLVMAARTGDGLLQLRSRQVRGGGQAAEVAGLAPGSVPGWAAYPAGVVWALREAGYPVGGARLVIDSDVPRGAGLSSSAALECSVALALADLYQLDITRPALAAAAQRAENDFAGVPCGIMDQSASLLCQPGHALLLDCRTSEGVDVPFDPAASGLELLVIDTGARRRLASGDYARTTTCGGTLVASASCVIHVTFTPTSPSTRAGLISVTDDAPGSPQTVSLSGVGVATSPAVCLSSSSINFGNQPVGTTSGTRPITVTNCGTANLVISSATTGANFTASTACATVTPGNICTVNVAFAPTAAGTLTGTLSIASNAASLR